MISEDSEEMNYLLKIPPISERYPCVEKKTFRDHICDDLVAVCDRWFCRTGLEKEIEQQGKLTIKLFEKEEVFP